MQTSQIQDLDTHAVFGGGQVQDFEMKGSMEAFTILSDTLYQDKPRACVREVLCNAWDAHIAAGREDVPVTVTINSETRTLTISDAGPGIPQDQVRSIYCTYFNSTKGDDNSQTGGFGLGSKAPFAVADHFTVANFHGGRRVVYAISRAGTETNGKPGFRPMVDTTTDQTGVTVTIPCHERVSSSNLVKLVREIATCGGMNVLLNGDQVQRLDLGRARALGYGILPKIGDRKELVLLSYGSVFYSLDGDREIEKRVSRIISTHIHIAGKQNRILVLFAEPGSIGVTPSREGLSWTERTQKAVHAILDRFEADIARYTRRESTNVIHATFARHPDKALRGNQIGNPILHRYDETVHDTPASVVRFLISRGVYHLNRFNRGSKRNCTLSTRHQAICRLFPAFRSRIMRGENHRTLSWRLHLRLAGKVGFLHKLYAMPLRASGIVKAGKSLQSARNMLVVAERQKDAFAFKDKIIDHTPFAHEEAVPVLIVPKGDHATRKRIERLAVRYGIRLHIAKRVVEKREAIASAVGRLKSMTIFDENGSELTRELTDEKIFLYSGVGAGRVDRPVSGALRLSHQLFGPIARATCSEDRDLLIRRGLRNLRDLVAEETARHGKSRAAQWGYETNNLANCGLATLWPKSYAEVGTIIKWRPDLLPHFWPVRRPKGENVERLILLGKLIAKLDGYDGFPEAKEQRKTWDAKRLLPDTAKPDPADTFLNLFAYGFGLRCSLGRVKDPEIITKPLLAALRVARKLK